MMTPIEFIGGDMAVRISCINKIERYNAFERIQFIGGVNPDGGRWKLSQQQAIKDIEAGKYAFYVSVNGSKVKVIVSISPHGNKYLKTEADGNEPNNLLCLPECP